jgi:hypothetical protein
MDRRLTPIPILEYTGARMLRQWSELRIHPLTTPAGVRKPAAMFSAACDQRKPEAEIRAVKLAP